jgi:hypothetical protein
MTKIRTIILPASQLAIHTLGLAIVLYTLFIFPAQTVVNGDNTRNSDHGRDLRANRLQESHHLDLHFTVAARTVAHPCEKNEWLQLSGFQSLQSYKLLRSCVFMIERSIVLSCRLAWFTTSEYKIALSLLWDPSIPIAHRKLII